MVSLEKDLLLGLRLTVLRHPHDTYTHPHLLFS